MYGLQTIHTGANWKFEDNPPNVIYLTDTETQAKYYATIVASNQHFNLGARSIPYVVMLRIRWNTNLKMIPDSHTKGDFYTSSYSGK